MEEECKRRCQVERLAVRQVDRMLAWNRTAAVEMETHVE